MAPFGTLHTLSERMHPNSRKIVAVAAIAGLELTVPPDFKFGVTNKTPEYLAKFPLGKIPSFEAADGFNLIESNAIALYVAQKTPDVAKKAQLLGKDIEQQALIMAWVFFTEAHLSKTVSTLCAWRIGFGIYNKEEEDRAEVDLKRWLEYIEAALKDKPWLEDTEGPSLADLTVAGSICYALSQYLDTAIRQEYPILTRWYQALMAVPELTKLYDIPFCELRKPRPEE